MSLWPSLGWSSCTWLRGRGDGSSFPQGSRVGLEPSAARTQDFPSALWGPEAEPSSPLETRLRLAFSRGSSGSSSTGVSGWLLSPETLRFLSIRRVGLCGVSGAAWSAGGSLAGCLSTKYFSTGRSLSSGASKGSCLLPALYSPVGAESAGKEGTRVTRSRQVTPKAQGDLLPTDPPLRPGASHVGSTKPSESPRPAGRTAEGRQRRERRVSKASGGHAPNFSPRPRSQPGRGRIRVRQQARPPGSTSRENSLATPSQPVNFDGTVVPVPGQIPPSQG